MMKENQLIVNKAFFGRTNCLKATLNKNKECYMHWGIKSNSKYEWIKAKFNAEELGRIIKVLDNRISSIALFHAYNNKKAQFWINRKGEAVLMRAKANDQDISKSLNEGEQEVLAILLKGIIFRMCLA